MTAPCPTFGFTVAMVRVASLEAVGRVSLVDAWNTFLENRGLYCTGQWREDVRAEYTVLSEASQATEADRLAAEAWLAERRELREWRVGALDDFGATEKARSR